MKFTKMNYASSLVLKENIYIQWVASLTTRRKYLALVLAIIRLVYKSTYKIAKGTSQGICLCLNGSLGDLTI